MKFLVRILIVAQFVFSPLAEAGRYTDDAIKAVKLQKIQIENTVQRLIINDLTNMSNQMFLSSQELSSNLSYLNALDQKLLVILQGFEELNNKSMRDIVSLKDDVVSYLKNYSDLNREYFSLTFLPSTTAILKENFMDKFDQFIEAYKYQCKVGRNEASLNTLMPASVKPDDVEYQIYFEIGNAAPNQARYKQANYVHEDWNRVAQGASYVFTAASSYAGGIYLGPLLEGGKVTYAATQTASAALSVAAAAAVVVAVAVVVMYSLGLRNHNKKMRDFYNGETHKILNTVSSVDINALYKEKCEHLVSTFDSIRNDMQNLKKGGLAAEAIKARVGNIKERENNLNHRIKKYQETTIKRINLESYKQGLCVQIQPSKNGEAPYTKKPQDCHVEDKKLICYENQCVISDPESFDIESLKREEEADFNAISTESLNLVTDGMLTLVGVDAQKIMNDYSSKVFEKIREGRFKAFRNLLRLINLIEEVPNEKLDKEIKIQERFYKFRKMLLEILAQVLKDILSGNNFSSNKSKFEKFKKSFENFYINFNHVNEVQDLNHSILQLQKFLDSK